MTVAELIAKLQTMPGDIDVIMGNGLDINNVIQVDFFQHMGADPDPECPEEQVVVIG